MNEGEVLGADDAELIHDPVERQGALETIKQHEAVKRALEEQEIRGRKNAFTRVLRDGGATLDDIAIVRRVLDKFCRKHTSTFHPDARVHAVAEGRREVILLVDDYIGLSIDELHAKLA